MGCICIVFYICHGSSLYESIVLFFLLSSFLNHPFCISTCGITLNFLQNDSSKLWPRDVTEDTIDPGGQIEPITIASKQLGSASRYKVWSLIVFFLRPVVCQSFTELCFSFFSQAEVASS